MPWESYDKHRGYFLNQLDVTHWIPLPTPPTTPNHTTTDKEQPMTTNTASDRYSVQDTWEIATRCVSDLEECQGELEELLKSAAVRSIPGIQKAVQAIEDAVDMLMNKVPNGADE